MNSSDFEWSLCQSSDILYDYPCMPCAEKDLSKEAIFYCDPCSKLLCQSCSKAHARLNKKHRLLGKKDVARWGPSRRTIRGDMCPRHVGHVIQWYCQQHESVGCQMCVSADHNFCKTIKDLDDVSKGIKQRTDFKRIPSDIKAATSDLNKRKQDKKHNRKSLNDVCQGIVQSIKDTRKRVEQKMADLEKDTIDKTEKLKASLDASLNDDEDAFDKAEAELQQCLDEYQSKAKRFESSAFASFKRCQRKLSETETLVQSIPTEPVKITFNLDKDIERMISLLENASLIGQCVVEKPTTATGVQRQDEKTKIIRRQSSGGTETAYKIMKTNKYGLKMKDETGSFACGIYGLCGLPSGSILAVDNMSHRVKQLNPRLMVIAHLGLPLSPQDICHIGDYQAVVTAGEQLYYLSAKSGELKLSRSVSLSHSAVGVAYHKDILYVTSGAALYQYTRAGKMIKKMFDGASVDKVAVAEDGSKIYVTDQHENSVITLDESGNRLAEFKEFELKNPWAVCVAPNGSVFVSYGTGDTVVQISGEGKIKLANLARRQDGVDRPRSMTFDARTSQLLVGQWSNEKSLLVLNVK